MSFLSVNDVFRSAENDHLYRVLWISDDAESIYVFDMDALDMPVLMTMQELRGVNNGIISQDISGNKMIAEGRLSDEEKMHRDDVWARMQSLLLNEPDIYDRTRRGQLILERADEIGFTKRIIYKYLRAYWLHGKTRNAFLPNYQNCGGGGKDRSAGDSKRGRPRQYGESSGRNVDDETKRIFEQAIKKYYHNRNGYTLKDAYDLMIKEHYTKFVAQPDGTTKAELLPENEIPTIGQFRYWYSKKHDTRRDSMCADNIFYLCAVGSYNRQITLVWFISQRDICRRKST